MSNSSPRRPSPSLADRLRHLRGRLAAKILFSERLNRWLHPRPESIPDPAPAPASPPTTQAQRYREFNRDYFASFYEQEKMLADRPRMDFYHAAIARHIRPGDHVIDLGTGTGILAAFASRRGAAKIHAIDHSVVIEHAKTVAAHNRAQGIDFVSTHSKDLKLDAPVDVILHEQMGDYLFDEDMVANITDLRDRLLKPGGLILPARFELFCEPVKIRDERLVPHIWELDVHGIDYSCLDRERPQDPDYYHIPANDTGCVDYFLTEPAPILGIDLATLPAGGLPREVHASRTVTRTGRFDGFVVYFQAKVDDDLALTTDPLDAGRATNWGFRLLRHDRAQVERGDTLDFTLSAENWSEPRTWRWKYTRTPREASTSSSSCEHQS